MMSAVAGALLAVAAAIAGLYVRKRRRSIFTGGPQQKPSMSGLPTTLRPAVYKQVSAAHDEGLVTLSAAA